MKKNSILLIVACFAIFFADFAKASVKKIEVRDKKLVLLDLILNWVPEPEFGGFYAAQELGFFDEVGLKVNIIAGGAGTPTIQMLAAGRAPFVITSGSELILARSKGADVIAVYNVFEKSPMGLMAHQEAGFSTLEDLMKSDSTLAIQRGLAFADFLERKYGFGSLKIVPYSGGVGHFLQNKKFSQQGFIFSEPVVARRSGANPKFFLLADVGYNPYVEILAVREGLAKESPELVRHFVNAVKKGWRAYNENPTSINELMSKLNPAMDLAAMNEGASNQKSLIGDGSMTELRWKEQVDFLLETKNITKPMNPATLYKNF
jgi:NitT/TauT family transport system substrate-binding protein